MGNKHQYSDLRDQILKGTKLAFKKLLEKAILEDDYLVISENGKVLKVPARSFNK